MHQRPKKKTKRQEKIQRILEEFKGVKNISSIKSATKSTLIPKIKNGKSEVITSRKGIANVSDELCSKLYADDQCDEEVQEFDKTERRTGKGDKGDDEKEMKEIPELSNKEVQAAIDNLKKKEKQVQQII